MIRVHRANHKSAIFNSSSFYLFIFSFLLLLLLSGTELSTLYLPGRHYGTERYPCLNPSFESGVAYRTNQKLLSSMLHLHGGTTNQKTLFLILHFHVAGSQAGFSMAQFPHDLMPSENLME